MGTKSCDVDVSEPDGDIDSLGAREVGMSGYGGAGSVVLRDLAGGAAPLFGRAGVLMSNRRQLEDREEGDENDRRSSCTQQALEQATRSRSTRHGPRG